MAELDITNLEAIRTLIKEEIAEYAGNTDCDIQPCHSHEFPSKVVRPSYSVLDKTKIKSTFDIKVPYWTESLKTCLKRLGYLKK